jgi:hypothetical protein
MRTFVHTRSSIYNPLQGLHSEKNCPSKPLLESSKFNRKMFEMPWQRVIQSRKGPESIPHLKTTPRNAYLNGLLKMPRIMLLWIEDVVDYCRETLSAAVPEGWVDSFLIRHQTELFETTSWPQENPRLEISPSFLDTMVECLRKHVQDCCADLIFNFDEVGISEWEDRVARKVIAPVSISGQTIHHGVHRNLKHMSVVCCVSASGESMTPFMVSSQDNDSAIEGLKAERFRMGVDLILEHRQKPYMNAALFPQYITTLLIALINKLRVNVQFTGKSHETRASYDFERTRRQKNYFPTTHNSDIPVPRFESIWRIQARITR